MPPQSITVIAPIRPDALAALRKTLKDIANPMKSDNGIMGFPDTTTHFARFVIIPADDDITYPGDREEAPNTNREYRLFFTAAFDGDLLPWVEDWKRSAPDLDRVWEACQGYDGNILQYIRRHRVSSNVFYSTFTDETVTTIRDQIAFRKKVQAMVDNGTPVEDIIAQGRPKTQSRTNRRRNLIVLLMIVLGMLGAVSIGMLVLLINAPLLAIVIGGALGTVAAFAFFTIIQPLLRAQRRELDISGAIKDELRRQTVIATEGDYTYPVSETTGREDVIAQNQFNLYLTFRNRNRLGRILQMRLLMIVLNIAGRYMLPSGILGGLSTVHFGQWIMIDGGRRLFFVTTYNGSWENYIADFVNKIYHILDIQLWNFEGFSREGTRDIAAFRRWLRRVQIQSDVFYSAYPQTSVRHILRDRELVDKFPNDPKDSAAIARWLELL